MIDLEALLREGFVEMEGLESEAHLVELARSIGKILPNPDNSLAAKVVANDGGDARRGTFSHAYGFSAFPMHTDTAYHSLPIRYLVMGMLKGSDASTRYINIKHIIQAAHPDLMRLAKESVYILKTFEQAKYTSAIFSNGNITGLRYDPHIMTPANRSARLFDLEFAEAMRSLKPKEVLWSGNKAIVLDNWACLHGRSRVVESNREILRIYVEQ